MTSADPYGMVESSEEKGSKCDNSFTLFDDCCEVTLAVYSDAYFNMQDATR